MLDTLYKKEDIINWIWHVGFAVVCSSNIFITNIFLKLRHIIKMSSPSIYIFYHDCTFKSTLAANSQPLSVRWWLRVNCVERIGIWPEVGNSSETYPQLEYTGCLSPSQQRQMGFLPWFIPNTSWLHGSWWSTEPAKNIQHIWRLQIKSKQNLSELDSENEATDFSRFIVIESLEVCLTKFSPFLLAKVLSTKATPKT